LGGARVCVAWPRFAQKGTGRSAHGRREVKSRVL
jgi:hypothetical protein